MLKLVLSGKRSSISTNVIKKARGASQIARSYQTINKLKVDRNMYLKLKFLGRPSIYNNLTKRYSLHLQHYNMRHMSNSNNPKDETAPKDLYSSDDAYSSIEATPKDVRKSLVKRLKKWSKRTIENTAIFLKDIVRLDGETVFKKISAFFARNYHRFVKTMKHVWHELKHVGRGFKTFKQDIQTSVADTKDMHYARYNKVTYSQTKKVQNVTRDFIKFIPFSLFIIVPGLELLLPAWLVIFPNSIPSQFQSDSAKFKKVEELIKNRNLAAEKLLYKYPKFLTRLSKSKKLSDEDKEEVKKFLALNSKEFNPENEEGQNITTELMPTDLLKYKHIFRKHASFKHFRVTTLREMAYFMGLNPVTGLNTINNILSFVGVNIKIDNPYVKWLTKLILRRELTLFFRKIRREDTYLSMENMREFPDSKLDSILLERGIDFVNLTKEQKLRDYKMWQAISNLKNVPDSLLLYCRLNEFAEDLYRTNYIENEADVVEMIQYNYEYKKRVLEEFFGIDHINQCLAKLETLRAKQIEDPGSLEAATPHSDIKNPTNSELFDLLRKSKKALKEFQFRHRSVVDEIEEIDKKNDDQLDQLERLIILGFLDRKEQHILQERYNDIYSHFKSNNEEFQKMYGVNNNTSTLDTKAEIEKFQSLLKMSKSFEVVPDLETELKKYKSDESKYAS